MTDQERPAHARLSPSAIPRWSKCTASIALTENVTTPEHTTSFAEFGTRSHAKLEAFLKTGKWFDITSGETCVAQRAVELLHEAAPEIKGKGYTVHAERMVDIRLGGLDTFGTADVIAVSPDGMHTIVADYKSGYTPVNAVENPQLAAYILGAHQAVGGDYAEGQTFTGIIMQPRVNPVSGSRVSRWDAEMSEILAVLEPARVAGEEIGKGHYRYSPSEETCKWCRASAFCPALAGLVEEAVGKSGASAGMIPDLTATREDRLADLLEACQIASTLETAITHRVLDADASGRRVIGLEVVQGRAGPRKWASESTAERLLREGSNREYHSGEFHLKKLMSPTQIQKEFPDAYSAVEEAVTRSEGRKSVRLADEKKAKLLARGKREADKASAMAALD